MGTEVNCTDKGKDLVHGEVNYGFTDTADQSTCRHDNLVSTQSHTTGETCKTEKGRPDADLSDGKAEATPSQDAHSKETDEQKKEKLKAYQLFRFADRLDIVLMVSGLVCAAVAGTITPLSRYLTADIITAFVFHSIYKNMDAVNVTGNYNYSHGISFGRSIGRSDVENIHEFMRDRYALLLVMLGVASVATGVIQYTAWALAGDRQMRRIRGLYFSSLMEQEVAWFDVNNTRMIAAKFATDMDSIARALGDGAGSFFRFLCMWVVSLVLSFVLSWKLTLACLSTFPLVLIMGGVNTKAIVKLTKKEREEYAAAGAVAEETLSGIRTVAAFNGQDKEKDRYKKNLERAEKVLMKKSFLEGTILTVFLFINALTIAIAMGYGAELFVTKKVEPGPLFSIYLLTSMGAMCLVRMTSYIQSLAEGCEAAFRIYPMIEEYLRTKVAVHVGVTPTSISGYLHVRGVTFSYPARPGVEVLKNVSFQIEAGETVAIVGQTGSGKSTIAQLLERFYTPQRGTISLDGLDIRDLDVQWLRRQIGFVGQEPVLFATSIIENIRYGNTDASDQEIIDAAILANAHSFIQDLPKGYDTFVGDSGCQLSGGQKQRLAIARALVRDPTILLLDEATSALDSAGEAIVQQAIDKAKEGRTTLVIAHRLSTVVGADTILVMKEGEIVEQGTHTELLDACGYYSQLVKHQMTMSTDEKVLMELQEELTDIADAEVRKLPTARTGDDEPEEEERALEVASPVKRLIGLNGPEQHLNVIGGILALVFGMMPPLMSVALTEMLAIFNKPEDEIRQTMWVLVGVVIGVAVAFTILRHIEVTSFARSASRLTTRIRERLFSAMIDQDMEYFDELNNRVGLLTNRLATDTVIVLGASAVKIGFALECISSLITALVVAFLFNWKLTLVVLCFTPFTVGYGVLTGSNMRGNAKTATGAVKTGEVLQESLNNIRLLRSLTVVETFKDNFMKKANELYRKNVKRWLPLSVLFNVTESNVLFLLPAVFTYGAYLVQYEYLEIHLVFRIFMVISYAAVAMGGASAYAEGFGTAKSAAARIFHTIDRKPKVTLNTDGKKKDVSGQVDLVDVVFHYPCRPDVSVLRGVNLSVRPGEKVALVGVSGCGKTTTTALLERFYDTTSGTVLADGEDIRDLDLRWYRSQIGIVSQEPVLFDRTISENIRYGDNSREVTSLEVIEAARTANLHGFVSSLPQGYDTMVGNKGTQLSGGEKQRVAIARALIRNPKLLLLDEATSALDSHNEQLVQEALDKASEGRTTIIIAHRLSTVQRCDRIVIIHEGQIVESGTHSELLTLKGLYYRLMQTQSQAQTSVSSKTS